MSRRIHVLLATIGLLGGAQGCKKASDGGPTDIEEQTQRRGPIACSGETLLTGSQIGTRAFRPGSLDVLQISADGKRLMTAGGAKAIVWDAQTGARTKEVDAWMGKASLSADGKRLAVADDGLLESKLVIVEVDTGEQVHSWEVESSEIDQVALGPRGERLAVARDGVVELRTAEKTTRLGTLEGETRTLAFSGAHVAAGGSNGQLRMWSAQSGAQTNLDAQDATIMATRFSPDGAVLAAADSDGRVRIFDVADGSLLHTFDATVPHESAELRKLAVSNEAHRVLVGSWSGVISLWDPEQPAPVAVLAEGLIASGAVAFTPDGTTAVAAVHDGAIRFWDASTGAEQPRREVGNLAAVDGALWLDGHRAVTAAGGHAANVWDLRCGRIEAELGGHARRVEHVAASADGKVIVTGDAGGGVRVWDGASLKLAHDELRQGDPIDALGLSDDGRWLALARRSGLTVLDGEFEVVWTQPRPPGDEMITSVAVAPDGSLAVVGDTMGNLRWLDMRNGALLASRDDDYASNVRAIRFSPSGEHLATAASDAIRIYDAKTGQMRASMGVPGWSVSNPAWFSDGIRLGFGDSDGHLWIVDAISGQVMRGAVVEDLDIGAIAIRGDDQAIVTGHDDTSLRVWLPADLGAVDETGLEVTLGMRTDAPPLLSGASARCPTPKSGELPGCAVAELVSSTYLAGDEAGALALSDDGALLAMPSGEHLAIIEVDSGRERHRLPCCEYGGPIAASFSADASTIAVTPGLGETKTWGLDDGRLRHDWGEKAVAIAPGPKGSWAAVNDEGTLLVVDANGKVTKTLGAALEDAYGYDPRAQLSVSSDGAVILIGMYASVELWDVATGEPSFPFEEAPPVLAQDEGVLWTSFDADDRLVVTGSRKRYTQKERGGWSSGARGFRLPEDAGIEDLRCVGLRPTCAAWSEDAVFIDDPGGKPAKLLEGETVALALAASGERVAVSDGRTVGVWEVSSRKRLTPEPVAAARRLASFAEGRLVTAHDDALRIWSPDGTPRALEARLREVDSAGPSRLVGLDDEALVRVDIETGTRAAISTGNYWSIAVSADATRVAGLRHDDGDEAVLDVFEVATGDRVWTRDVADADGLAISEDGSRVAFGTSETVELWEVGERRVATMQVEHGVHQLDFTPDERTLVALGGDHVDVYATEDGRELASFGDGLQLQVFAIAPDGQTLVTGGADGLLRLFELPKGRQLAGLDAEGAEIYGVVAASLERVVTLDGRGRTLTWDLSPLLEP